MGKLLSSLMEQFKKFYKNLTPTKRMSMVASLAIVSISIMVVSYMISSPSFVPFIRDVSAENLPLVIEKLKEKNIPFLGKNRKDKGEAQLKILKKLVQKIY